VPQPNPDHDPLLEFSIEPDAIPEAPPPPAPPSQPVAAAEVPATPPVKAEGADEIERLRARIDHLEREVDQSAKDLGQMKSEIATLVGAAKDIKRPAPARAVALPIASAIGGVLIGIAAGVWFWMSTGSEPIVQARAMTVASEPLPPPQPAAVAPEAQPSIVQAAAITPVRDTPVSEPRVHAAPPRVARAPADYVGTLSIDADPEGDVFIDRKPAGKTPMRAENLKAGSHLVWIERDGYRRFTRVVLVPSDRVTRLVADLEPAQH
jgi:hypothetical protein